ncbi:MAG TPA: hypothetical protein VGC77_04325 [Rhodopseudomonas sp.]|uniref:hypothetical protein n=1 Tax=Rhodopseudomonas sp. TaxID=1078 RepID=UPI002ED7B719
MNTAMQSMMPMMGGMSPMMMNPMMMNPMMMNPMMGMMNGMPGMAMPMIMCKMTCRMTPNGMMSCEMAPMDDSMKDMFAQCCQNMMSMMATGMPMMMSCGGMMMMGMMPMPAKA